MAQIEFGTDGWRGVIAKDYTMENLSRVAVATADYLTSPERKNLPIYTEWNTPYRPASEGVLIGYDTRFLSEEFALLVARVMVEEGIPVKVSDEPIPTPALSWSVKEREAAAGVMITASHNPAEYNGFKFKCEAAASAPPHVTREIEKRLPAEPPSYDETAAVGRVDMSTSYIEGISALVDGDVLRDSSLLAVVDSMYGSARGFFGKVLGKFDVPTVQIRGEDNPGFHGIQPEPLEKHLDPLKEAISREGRGSERTVFGVVTDGDGDRVSAMDEEGNFIDAHRTYSLLFKYLAEEREWKGKAVKNFPLTDMVFKIGKRNDVEVDETPVGFKYIGEKMIKEDVMIGGEESGGIGIKNHIPERDGLLCGLLLLEMVAARGTSGSELIEEMMEEVGYHYYHRDDIHLEEREEVVELAKEDPPEEIGGFKVEKMEDLDGLKLRFSDGWLLLRASGTEPVLRLYSEMDSMDKVHQVLEEAEKYARKLVGG